jgi:hypothetical protein
MDKKKKKKLILVEAVTRKRANVWPGYNYVYMNKTIRLKKVTRGQSDRGPGDRGPSDQGTK